MDRDRHKAAWQAVCLALGAFQKSRGLKIDCWPTQATLAHLRSSAARQHSAASTASAISARVPRSSTRCGRPPCSTVTWSSTALSIWLATVRFQISS